MIYDPVKHHRRSIRLKGHDYAGGGLYFVTICAHRNTGPIFAPDDVREMVGRVWECAVGAGLVPAPNENEKGNLGWCMNTLGRLRRGIGPGFQGKFGTGIIMR